MKLNIIRNLDYETKNANDAESSGMLDTLRAELQRVVSLRIFRTGPTNPL